MPHRCQYLDVHQQFALMACAYRVLTAVQDSKELKGGATSALQNTAREAAKLMRHIALTQNSVCAHCANSIPRSVYAQETDETHPADLEVSPFDH